ncbi:MAG: dehypoxanthine futalosine cyclase [Planctomycetota bacterium]|nr:dehypoxanthine futalosine cyclase [Planctomycetota bacterium]
MAQTLANTERPVREWLAPLAAQAQTGSTREELDRLERHVAAGGRITQEEALFLHAKADLLTLGRMATSVRLRKNPDARVTYIVDRNLNPTNVCITDCGFCAFYRTPGHREAYVLSRDEIYKKVEDTVKLGGKQLLMQGGHHPNVLSDFWCELISDINARFDINCHALSAPEIEHFARYEKRPIADVIADLKEAGMGSVPGAGAEILVERVREIIAPKKTTTDDWLEVHRQVHKAGLRSSATMMFGNVETIPERIEHMLRLRDLQDETGGFTAFASWNTQPEGVPQEHLFPRTTTPAEYLRVQSIARIFLDNFDHMQTSYVTQGTKLAQVSLAFGCDDFGGTMLEENVVSAAGCANLESIQHIESLIRNAGYEPLQRNSWYGVSDERFDGETWPRNREEAAHHIGAPETMRAAALASRPTA